MGIIQDLFSTYPFMPHEHCFNTETDVLWMHVIGDAITAFAYFIIPIFLAYFVWKRKDLKYKGIFWLFVAFILSCGTTHILAIIGMWDPYYRLEGVVKLGTGLISIVTALALVPIVPMALKVPSSSDLAEKNKKLSFALQMLKTTEKEQRKMNDLLIESQKLTNLGSWEWELSTDMLIASEEFFQIFETEVHKEPLKVQWFFDMVHRDDIDKVHIAIDKGLKDTGEVDIKFKVKLNDQNIKYLHSRSRVQFDHNRNPVAVIGTTIDITKQVKDEIALREYTKKIEETNQYLKSIAYATSHDLKEPLRGIVSYSQLVLKMHEDELSYDAKDKMGFVIEEGKRMNSMIESLLSFSKMESVDPVLTQVDMNEVVSDVLQRFRVTIEETEADINVSSLPTLPADKEQMNILLHNLIGNALKFNNGNPKIDISAIKVGPEWEFRVKDNGIGFDKDSSDQIFDLFKTLDSKSNKNTGSGIGLSLCRTIVRSHGGRIWVLSKEGSGSTFHFTLPIAA